jgi:hypothetical protein
MARVLLLYYSAFEPEGDRHQGRRIAEITKKVHG